MRSALSSSCARRYCSRGTELASASRSSAIWRSSVMICPFICAFCWWSASIFGTFFPSRALSPVMSPYSSRMLSLMSSACELPSANVALCAGGTLYW